MRRRSSRQKSGKPRTDRQRCMGAPDFVRGWITEPTSTIGLAGDAASSTLQIFAVNVRLPRAPRHRCDDGGVPPPEDPEDYIAPAAQRVRAGTLLLANTDLLEPTFRRSVIYIVEHNDGGTLGVVLNRASETAVYNVLPQWAKLASKPKTMFIGGPVKRDAALCLAVLRVGAGSEGG